MRCVQNPSSRVQSRVECAFLGPVLRDPNQWLFGSFLTVALGLLGLSKRKLGALRVLP